MSRAFADIAFTPSVKAAQTQYGSRESNEAFELAEDVRNQLTEAETNFIHSRDSFYQATVGENGWPYVQHRGGPIGFLKVLDERTIGYADFRGNRQYISVGNINSSSRISLILMDYPNRSRLKLWGTAHIVHESEQPEIVAKLEVASYRARIERAVIIKIEAIEWNCPQHITPRFTEAEIQQLVDPILQENRNLKQLLQKPLDTKPELASLGNGELTLVICGIRQLTPRVRAYELRTENGKPLPFIRAGSHLKIPVSTPNEKPGFRHYSIISNPNQRDTFEIAVQLEPEGSGGSAFIHKNFSLGTILKTQAPENYFPLSDNSQHVVLIAAGIGITPIKSMLHVLRSLNTSFELHYAGRNRESMVFLTELEREFSPQLHVYISNERQRIDLPYLIKNAPNDSDFYVCGPNNLTDEFRQWATQFSIPATQIHTEKFTASISTQDTAVELYLSRSQKSIHVSANETLLDALEDAGINLPFDCRVGKCGACAVKLQSGIPDHRDQILSEAQKQQGMLCVCVSRALSKNLTLDL